MTGLTLTPIAATAAAPPAPAAPLAFGARGLLGAGRRGKRWLLGTRLLGLSLGSARPLVTSLFVAPWFVTSLPALLVAATLIGLLTFAAFAPIAPIAPIATLPTLSAVAL